MTWPHMDMYFQTIIMFKTLRRFHIFRIEYKLCVLVLGVTIVTPIRNDPGHLRSLHANILGQVVPNGLPTRKKTAMWPSVDLTNEAQHVGTCKVSLESEQKGIAWSTVLTRFVLFIM